MNDFTTAYSQQNSVSEAVQEIAAVFSEYSPRAIIFFASSKYDLQDLGEQLQTRFIDAAVFGCSTAGELISGKMSKNSVVAMSISPQIIPDLRVEIVENVKQENNVPRAFQSFAEYFGEPLKTADSRKYVGIILIDGLSGAEEKIIEKIGDLTDVTFVGGSAGDDMQFKSTQVFANGKAYTNAAVLALLKPGVPFGIIKTQSFNILPKPLIATQVDEASRRVVEFNHKPAATAYAEALGISSEQLPARFMHNPVGLIVDGEPFVRSPQQIIGTQVSFYCSVLNGMELNVLESADIIQDTQNSIAAKRKELRGISAIINFNCLFRTLELEQQHLTEAYGNLFSDIPTVGFSTYGEQYLGHINQTATMLVFK